MSEINKRILVFSDSHGEAQELLNIFNEYKKNDIMSDMVIHLGNGEEDMQELKQFYSPENYIQLYAECEDEHPDNTVEIDINENIKIICNNGRSNNENGKESFERSKTNVIFMYGQIYDNFIMKAFKEGEEADKCAVFMCPGSIHSTLDYDGLPKHSMIEIDTDGNIFIENRTTELNVVNRMLVPLTNFEKDSNEYKQKSFELARYILKEKPEYIADVYNNGLNFKNAISESFEEVCKKLNIYNVIDYFKHFSYEQMNYVLSENKELIQEMYETTIKYYFECGGGFYMKKLLSDNFRYDEKLYEYFIFNGSKLNTSDFKEKILNDGYLYTSRDVYYNMFGKTDFEVFLKENIETLMDNDRENINFIDECNFDMREIVRLCSRVKYRDYSASKILEKAFMKIEEPSLVLELLDQYKENPIITSAIIYTNHELLSIDRLNEAVYNIDIEGAARDEDEDIVRLFAITKTYIYSEEKIKELRKLNSEVESDTEKQKMIDTEIERIKRDRNFDMKAINDGSEPHRRKDDERNFKSVGISEMLLKVEPKDKEILNAISIYEEISQKQYDELEDDGLPF